MSSSEFDLGSLLDGMHQGIEQRLTIARAVLKHPVMKGDASEAVWLEFLRLYLPHRYQVTRAIVVDSTGAFSQSNDIVIHDRQYTPFIFHHEGQSILPAESVYAVFEAKQELTADYVAYAADKAGSVRGLLRTSLDIAHADGTASAREPKAILAGILTLEASWSPPLGNTLMTHLGDCKGERQLDLGCVAATGTFMRRGDETYETSTNQMPTTAFLFELIARLQALGTVTAIDMRAYAKWLK